MGGEQQSSSSEDKPYCQPNPIECTHVADKPPVEKRHEHHGENTNPVQSKVSKSEFIKAVQQYVTIGTQEW